MDAIYEAHALVERSGGGTTDPNRPPIFKVIGIILAVCSGLFIGSSFVLKKVGLLRANDKYNEVAGEGYGYLKNWYWWSGMTLMIVGEICNFVAYAFVDAILVTPLGALSVVVTTILSAIFLKERLSFVGKVGCFNCIIGSVVIVLNAPSQSAVADIQQMQHYVIAPGFLTYTGVVILACTFIALWVGPRYGNKSMMVYISICSLIGGLSVVATQGLGSAIIAQARGKAQFNQWFLYVLLVFVIATLLTEIIYLNKALNLYNAALVTPTYYVFFTSATIITSAILFRGFKGTPLSILTVVMGFFQICSGVVLLQLSKSSKDVPDAAVLNGDLDQIRQVGEQEQPETEPKADAIRGAAALVRRFSSARAKMEQKEFERLHQEKMQDLEPVGENEVVQWDGLRRRKTIIGENSANPIVRRKTLHPPLGMSYFPDGTGDEEMGPRDGTSDARSDVRSRASTMFSFQRQHTVRSGSTVRPVPIDETVVEHPKEDYAQVSQDHSEAEYSFGLPAALRKTSTKATKSPRSKALPADPEAAMLSPEVTARRQWSFSNLMGRHRSPSRVDGAHDRPQSRAGIGSRDSNLEKKVFKHATEEERLGLVKGDSAPKFLDSYPQHPPVYPHPTHVRFMSTSTSTSTSSTLPPSQHDIHAHGRLHNPSHYRQNSNASTESDVSDEYQMTHRPDFNTSARTPSTAIVTAAETTRSTSINVVTPPPNAAIPYNFERRGTQGHKRPSPPPTYRQAQAQVLARDHNPPRAYSPVSVRRQAIYTPMPPEVHILEADRESPVPLAAPSQAQRGRVLERGSAQIVQVSDHSQNLSTSQNHTRKPSESTSVPMREEREDDESARERHGDEIVMSLGAPPAFEFERPISLYPGDPYGTPRMRSSNSPGLRQAATSGTVDTNAAETKDRFQEQSRRERDRRRVRMASANGGMI